MTAEGWRLPKESTWFLVLMGLAVVSSLWAALSWGRFGRERADVVRREEDVPRVREQVERLLALRAQVGDTSRPADGSPGPELIPFLESAARRAGIPKQAALRIDPRNPKPVPARPGLLEQETSVELSPVSIRGLVQFLAAAEKQFPALEIREIVLNPLTDEAGWEARVLLVVALSASTGSPP